MKKLVVFEDIDYAVVAEPQSHHVDYRIYRVKGIADGIGPIYESAEDQLRAETEDIEKAYVYAHGYVKWDGCSNWHFDQQDDVMLHFCERDQLLNLGVVLQRCWDMTEGLIDSWCA